MGEASRSSSVCERRGLELVVVTRLKMLRTKPDAADPLTVNVLGMNGITSTYPLRTGDVGVGYYSCAPYSGKDRYHHREQAGHK